MRQLNAWLGVLAWLGMAPNAMAAAVTQQPYGVTAAGQAVEVFTLSNSHGMIVKVLNYGGVITEIDVPDRQGKIGNVVLALQDLSAYEARPNFSSLIGRFANRIDGGGFMLDGVRHALPSNADGISSHGGVGGFSTKVWQAMSFKANEHAGVRMTYVSHDGENGYPGTLTTTVSFTLDGHDQLTLDYVARTDKPTVVNLTHHVYFNLAGEGSAANHAITINASRYTPMDSRKIASGEITSVDGTPFDLRQPMRVGDGIAANHAQIVLANGYDHNFVLDKPEPDAFVLAARLSEPTTGRVLWVTTTEPGMQFYSSGGFDGKLRDARGTPLLKAYGLALETQHFPNSPNRANFPSTVLRPGEVLRSRTRYSFGVEKGR